MIVIRVEASREELVPLLKEKRAAAKSLQSYPILCDPIDGIPPGSPVLGFSRQERWSGLLFPSPMHAKQLKDTVTCVP